jgi:hypothetical protein
MRCSDPLIGISRHLSSPDYGLAFGRRFPLGFHYPLLLLSRAVRRKGHGARHVLSPCPRLTCTTFDRLCAAWARG